MSIPPPADRPVLATYLHLPAPDRFRPALRDDPDLLLTEAEVPSVDFYRFLYAAVGRTFS